MRVSRGAPSGASRAAHPTPLVLLDRDLPHDAAPLRLRRLTDLRRSGVPVPPFGMLTARATARVVDEGLPPADDVVPGRTPVDQDALDQALGQLWHHTARGGLVPVRVGPVDRPFPALTGELVKTWDHLRRVVDAAAVAGDDETVAPVLVVRAVEAFHRGTIERAGRRRSGRVEVTMESTLVGEAEPTPLRRGRWIWRQPLRARTVLPRDLRQELGRWSRTLIAARDLQALGWTIDPSGTPSVVDVRLR